MLAAHYGAAREPSREFLPPWDRGYAWTSRFFQQRLRRSGSHYRPWAELLKRTFGADVLQCEKCKGRLKLVAMVTDPKSIARYLDALGEPTEPPTRTPSRGPPYWKSTVLRLRGGALGDVA